MENASKALIIAGAILISILIIAIGMYVYTKSQSTVVMGGELMSKQEIEAFNNTWTAYEGTLTGAQVKGLINDLIANYKVYVDEPTKVPEYVGPGATGTDYVSKLNNAFKTIKPKASYTVSLTFDSGTSLVHTITVEAVPTT